MADNSSIPQFYGYIMNIKAVLRDALRNSPRMEKAMKTEDPFYWMRKALRAIGTKYAGKVEIASLDIGGIWIGKGMQGLCWILPDEFRKKNLTEMQREQLSHLERILETDESPGLYYSIDVSEPKSLKNVEIPDDFYDAYCLDRVMKLFGDKQQRESTVARLWLDLKEIADGTA